MTSKAAATPSSNAKLVVAHASTLSSAATTSGATIDTQGFDGGYLILTCGVGTITGTSVTCDVKVVEDDNSSFSSATDVSGAAFTQFTNAVDDTIIVGSLEIGPRERYMRVSVTVAGTSPVVPLVVSALLVGPSDSSLASTSYDFEV